MSCKLLLLSLFFLQSFYGVYPARFPSSARLLSRIFDQKSKPGSRQRVLNFHTRMPWYMIKIYKELQGNGMKKPIPYHANVIRGINSDVTKVSKAIMEIRFNFDFSKSGMTITRDEIHLYMAPPDPLDRSILKPFKLSFRDIQTKQLIRNFIVPAFNQGWQVLSMKNWTNNWVNDSTTPNKGMLLTIYRGKNSNNLAHENPFVDFPTGNDPYLILFASESVPSLMAWRFLINTAVNTVAKDSKVGRGPRDMSRQSQCSAVNTDVSLTNMKMNNHDIIMEPKVYRMTKCSQRCVTRLVPGFFDKTQSQENYCCVPTRRRDFAVLTKSSTTQTVTFEIMPRLMPTDCVWAKQ